MLRWYLIYTKPSGESVACDNLARQGFYVYFPRLLQPAKRAGRRCYRVSPLFSRYVFLQLDESCQSLAPVRSTVGISCIVQFGQRYATVPDSIVQDLRSRADPASGLHTLVRPSRMSAGASVKVRIGLFEGLEGVFEREDGEERAVMLLNVLGYQAQLHVPSSLVMAGNAA
jgi:transcriptional antiterminator RfaH